jgi:hypothetical protein
MEWRGLWQWGLGFPWESFELIETVPVNLSQVPEQHPASGQTCPQVQSTVPRIMLIMPSQTGRQEPFLEMPCHQWQCIEKKECHSVMLKKLNCMVGHTALALQQLLLVYTQDTLLYDVPIADIHFDRSMTVLAEAQAPIGRCQILFGRFAIHWKQSHHRYFGSRATKTNNGGSGWLTSVITK